MLKVFSKRCNQCLLSKNRIVSKERADSIINQCKKEQRHFICHKATINGEDIMCKGFYDQYGEFSQLVSIAERLNAIEFVEQK